jgi:CheY-like chemotaxis protein
LKLSGAPTEGMRQILLIDDDVEFGDLTRRRLTRLGYHVKVHGGGSGAMELLLRGRYDLVMLDVNMPGLTGPEVATMIRSTRGGDVKLVFYSSLDVPQLRAIVERHGADGYVSKSASTRELESRIAEVLGESLAQRAVRSFSPYP